MKGTAFPTQASLSLGVIETWVVEISHVHFVQRSHASNGLVSRYENWITTFILDEYFSILLFNLKTLLCSKLHASRLKRTLSHHIIEKDLIQNCVTRKSAEIADYINREI